MPDSSVSSQVHASHPIFLTIADCLGRGVDQECIYTRGGAHNLRQASIIPCHVFVAARQPRSPSDLAHPGHSQNHRAKWSPIDRPSNSAAKGGWLGNMLRRSEDCRPRSAQNGFADASSGVRTFEKCSSQSQTLKSYPALGVHERKSRWSSASHRNHSPPRDLGRKEKAGVLRIIPRRKQAWRRGRLQQLREGGRAYRRCARLRTPSRTAAAPAPIL